MPAQIHASPNTCQPADHGCRDLRWSDMEECAAGEFGSDSREDTRMSDSDRSKAARLDHTHARSLFRLSRLQCTQIEDE